MADETSNRIGFDIVVDTKASDNNITTIKQDISNLQKAIEQANKTGLSINIDGVKRSLEEAQKLQGEFISKLDKLNASRLDNVNKIANREIEIFRKASEEKLKIAQRDAEQQAKAQQSRGTNYFSQAKSGLQSEWMNNYYDYSKGNIGAREYAQNVSKIKVGAQELTKEINKMGVAFDNSTERGISFSNKLKSHLYWITAGTLLGAVTAIPYEVFTTLEKLDTGMAGMNQVIDHTAIATVAAKTGISEQTVAQAALNTEQDKFISIASTYGETIDKVIDSGKRKLAA